MSSFAVRSWRAAAALQPVLGVLGVFGGTSLYSTSGLGRCARIALVAAIAVGLFILAGCGKSEVDTSGSFGLPPDGSQAPKVAATGAALSEPLAFDQLALESPVNRYTNKNGLVFLRFRYADRDGSIYQCELPEEMSKGTYTIDDWTRTFGVYKLPKVVGKKKVAAPKGPKEIGDFPFISPKPVKPHQEQQSPQAAPQPSPGMPPMSGPRPIVPESPMPAPPPPRPVND